MPKTIPLYFFTLILLVSLVFAIPQDGITINSPANGTWTNLVNYTSGFNFSWSDNEASYNATCTLHIGTTNNVGQLIGGTTYAEQTVPQSTNTVLSMNATFPTNNTLYYWTIKCINSTYLPWRATDTKILKQDISTPGYTINSISFTNNTWGTSGSIRVDITALDDDTQGEELTVTLRNTSNGASFGSGSVANGTAENVTFTMTDGNYTVKVNISDPAGNTNATGSYIILIDSTNPAITYNSPANATVRTVNWTLLNFSITETNLDTIRLNWSGTAEVIGSGNCTGTAPYVCTFNKTEIVDAKDISYYYIVNDSAGNEGTTTARTVSVDEVSPVITTNFNFTISASTVSYKLLVTDITPTTCVGTVYDKDDAATGTTITGAYTLGTTTSNCTGTFTSSSIGTQGDFRILWNVTDAAGNLVQANSTGIFTSVYASEWNLITYGGVASTTKGVCDTLTNCTQVAIFNNTAQSYTTYAASTPSVNNDTVISPGDAILVYVNADDSVLSNNYLPGASDATRFITLYDGGWNTMGLTEDANISAVYNAITNGTANKNITWASWVNADSSSFSTCRRSTSKCTGTSSAATDIDLPEGFAVWVLTDQLNNYTINRTGVIG